MSSNPPRPVTENVVVAGPSGPLEAIVDSPPEAVAPSVAVICHPHPLHGGTMTNKVVHMLAKACNELGLPAVRFNYRGVGASEGKYDEGNGETDDAVAVLDWVQQRWPGAGLWLGGFSFGGAVAIRAAVEREVERLITVAPAVQRVPVGADNLPTCPWLLVQGDRDELVDATQTQRWAMALRQPPEVVVMEGVEHFFHGRMNDLRTVVLDWVRRTS
jgi:alpha/beta superfamily hydrolase